jgi:hypothetical protein
MYLNELEVREEHQIGISKRFATVDNLNNSKDINSAWSNIEENVISSATNILGLNELKQHKPWFDEQCLRFYIKGSRLKCTVCRIQTKAM